MGVDVSLKRLNEADLVLLVLDGSQPLTAEDRAVMGGAAAHKKNIVVINKTDLTLHLSTDEISAFGPNAVFVSATQGTGLDDLKRTMRHALLSCPSEPELVITNARHKAALERAEKSLEASLKSCAEGLAQEIVAVDLHLTMQALEEILGMVTNDDILDRIFSQFCIGK